MIIVRSTKYCLFHQNKNRKLIAAYQSMPLTWSRGCTAVAMGARHVFVAVGSSKYLSKGTIRRIGATRKYEVFAFDSISPTDSKRKFNSCDSSRNLSPYFSNMTETKLKRLPGWAGGLPYYAPSRKTHGRKLVQSPYLSTVEAPLPLRSSGFLGEFPRTPSRSPRSVPCSPPRTPKSTF